MRDERRCPKCSFHEILYVPTVSDHAGEAGVQRLAVFSVFGQFAACVCRRCGFTELYAQNPAHIPFDRIPGAQVLVGKPAAPYR